MGFDGEHWPTRCPACGVEAAASADRCPGCGRELGAPDERQVVWRPPATRGMKVVAWLLLAVMFGSLAVGLAALLWAAGMFG